MTDKNAPQGKVELKIGNISFSGEGDQDWLDKQVTKLLEAATDGVGDAAGDPGDAGAGKQTPKYSGSLASYLRAKGGSKQVQRFLATSAWLFQRGNTALSTSDVAKALRDNHQSRLTNAADCLNQNVTKGFCEKTGDGFFITPEGWVELGEKQ